MIVKLLSQQYIKKLASLLLAVTLIIFIDFIGCVGSARADRFECYTSCSLALEDSSECKKSENNIPGDYRTVGRKGRGDVVVLAIHGGAIELNTDKIAKRISRDNNWDSYTFIGRIKNQTCKDLVPGSTKPNFDVLHITSEHFNDPVAIEAVRSHAKAVSIHGHRRDHASGSICVGGLNKAQRDEFISYVNSNRSSFSLYHLNPIDAPNQESGDCSEGSLRGVSPSNIVNKNPDRMGLQLELNSQMRRDLVKIGADYEELRQIIYGAVVQAMKK